MSLSTSKTNEVTTLEMPLEQPRQGAEVAESVSDIPSCSSACVSYVQPETVAAATRRGRHGYRAAAPVMLAVAACVISSLFRTIRRQSKEVAAACSQLRAAQEQLRAKEQSLDQAEAQRKHDQDAHIGELSRQVSDAQLELAAAREMCRQASSRLEQSMSDLSVSETELRSARSQLQTASRDLTLTRARLEATEGELGLTRSQNELMKREVDILRRQLAEAGQQLEGYILVSRGRKNRAQPDDEDDLAAAAGADWY